MNCPKCNTVNNTDARFCGSCGYDMATVPQQNANSQIKEIQREETLDTTQQNQGLTNNTAQNTPPQQTEQSVTESVQQPVSPNQPNLQQTPSDNIQQRKKSNKSLFIIIGAIIAVIAIVISVILLATPREETQQKQKINDIFNPKQLIKVKKDNKYGYINTKGEFKIKPIYEDATDFQGNFAVVRIEVETDGLTKTVSQVIDNKGKVKKQVDGYIEYIEETSSWIIDDELYNSSMKKISPKGVKVNHKEDNYYIWVNSEKNTGGIMNEKGKPTYTYEFKEGENEIYITIPNIDETLSEKYCIVNVENNYGLVNCDTGVIVKELSEDRITSNSDNIFTVKEKSTYDFKEILYIQNDKIMYQSTNSKIDLYYYPGYVTISDRSKSYSERYTYLHTKTGEIKDKRPEIDDSEEAEDINEWEKLTNNKKFSCSTGYGLMNNEKITLPCEWDGLEYLEINLYKYLKDNNKEYIYGKKDDKWYLINLKDKKAIVEFNTTYITPKDNTTFVYYTDKNGKNKKVYNLLSNKSLNIDSNNVLTVYSNYVTVKSDTAKTLKYYNNDLELIYTENL